MDALDAFYARPRKGPVEQETKLIKYLASDKHQVWDKNWGQEPTSQDADRNNKGSGKKRSADRNLSPSDSPPFSTLGIIWSPTALDS